MKQPFVVSESLSSQVMRQILNSIYVRASMRTRGLNYRGLETIVMLIATADFASMRCQRQRCVLFVLFFRSERLILSSAEKSSRVAAAVSDAAAADSAHPLGECSARKQSGRVITRLLRSGAL